LIFPHHENEIAQSRCAHGTAVMANYWMHNGFLQVEGEKMSKSTGNFVTIRELRENWNGYGWPGEALRFNMLRTHYRQPIDWTLDSLNEAHKILWSWYENLHDVESTATVPNVVLDALGDDLNTARVISELHGLHKSNNRSELLGALRFLGFSGDRKNLSRIASAAGIASGLSTATGQSFVLRAETGHFAVKASDVNLHVTSDSARVEHLIEARTAARARKDFKESDRIRDELAAMGVVLKDGKDADGKPVTTWEIAR
jgi:cysteinyl-tRNA synthetase